MPMYNPPHPGLVIADNFDSKEDVEKAAAAIGLTCADFKQILQGKAPITPEIAYLLHEKLHLMKPRVWIKAQAAYDIWQAEHNPRWQQAVRQKFLPHGQDAQ